MKYIFVPMTKEFAQEISYNWKYDGVYSFYDMIADEEDLSGFLNEENWEKKIFAVGNKNNKLIGFYSYYFEECVMWIGFGLRPDLTGKGYGYDFVEEGILFGINKFNYKKNHIMLAVADFNKRAIKLFEKLGFEVAESFLQKANGGQYNFVKMKKMLK